MSIKRYEAARKIVKKSIETAAPFSTRLACEYDQLYIFLPPPLQMIAKLCWLVRRQLSRGIKSLSNFQRRSLVIIT